MKTLGPSISGTKCDRDKMIFQQKEGVNQIMMRHTIGAHSDRKPQKLVSSLQNLPTMPKYGSTPLPLGLLHDHNICKLIKYMKNKNLT